MAGHSYSETIRLKTDFNPSDILSGIKKIQEALSQTSSTKGKTMLSGVSVEIDKVERSLRQMESQMEKGFRSDSEVKNFLKTMESAEDAVLSIHKGLKDVANVSIGDGAKDLEKQLALIDKKIQAVTKNFKTEMNTLIKDSALPKTTKEYLETLVNQGKTQKSVYQEAKAQLQEEINLTKKLYTAREDAIKAEAKENAARKAAKRANLFGTGGIEVDQLEPSKKYGAKSGADLGKEVRATNAQGNILPTTKSANFKEVINNAYVKILQDIATAGGTAEDAIQKLFETFKRFGLISEGGAIDSKSTISNSISNRLRSDFGKITEAMSGVTTVKDNKELLGIQNQIESYKELYSSDFFEQLGAKAEQYGVNLSNLAKQQDNAALAARNQTDALRAQVGLLDEEGNNIKDAQGQWDEYRQSLIQVSNQQQQVDNGFKQIISRLQYFFSIGTLINFVRKEISQTFQDVQNLDKSFAQIAMVTKYSVNDMWQNYDQYAAMANRLGQATNDVIQASALYYQQGLPPTCLTRWLEFIRVFI